LFNGRTWQFLCDECAVAVSSIKGMKMRFKASIQVGRVVGVIVLVCGLQLYGQRTASGGEAEAKAATITSFDPPGTAINPAGTITGNYGDANGTIHGFLRAPDGTFTTLDLPGTTYTLPQAINPAGTITGFYLGGYAHGFLRAPGGSLTTFDPPGSTNTQPQAINPAGTIMGFYFLSHRTNHGFLRGPSGSFTSFDPPGSTDTQPLAINPAGMITGNYTDASGNLHGFLRIPAHQDDDTEGDNNEGDNNKGGQRLNPFVAQQASASVDRSSYPGRAWTRTRLKIPAWVFTLEYPLTTKTKSSVYIVAFWEITFYYPRASSLHATAAYFVLLLLRDIRK
jgi:hypothetical protein